MYIKNVLNSFFSKFGFEIHGISYLQAIQKLEFKSNELTVLKKIYGNRKFIIYDVGANSGKNIETYVNAFPNAHTYGFEPFEPHYETLVLKFQNSNHIILEKLAVSNISSRVDFHVNKSPDTNSLLPSKKTGLSCDVNVKTLHKIKVDAISLDHYVEKGDHSELNFLKIDIQGNELNALKGASNLLINKKIDLIFIETYFLEQYENQPLFIDIVNYLTSFGYVIQDLYNPIYGKGKLAWCDTMFARNDLIIN